MKAHIVSIEGKKLSELELPRQFSADIDEGLIKRAVLAIQSAGVQLKYPTPLAGRNNTAIYVGSRGKPTQYRTINVGHARKPRMKNRRGLLYGRVAGIPATVGGPKAHPPKPTKVWEEKINKKEKRKATDSAIAATGKMELVKRRGHIFSDKISFPIIVESKLEGMSKTKNVTEAFEAMGIISDVEKAKNKRQIRAGKGKKRGRKHKSRKSILVVAKDSGKIFLAARNIEGVDVVSVRELNADMLAPGALPGRLTVWTEDAIKELGAEKKEKPVVKAAVKAEAK
ncbi:MAG TPA: 50S ribosomal protein L4 [archaeon]|nr:50S ribosomal protein L4 [archaeon]